MKRKPVLLFAAIFILISCNQKKSGYEIDCDYEKKQAQNDFNYKNYTWTIFSGQGYDFLGEQEFKGLLYRNHIQVKKISVPCIHYPSDRYMNCGETEMNRLIEKKFGKNFIDSLRYISKQDFVKKYPKEIFSYQNCSDLSRYPNSTAENQFKKIQEDYFVQYPIPERYVRQNKEVSYISAQFILAKNGEIKDLSIESIINNSRNKVFEKQFSEQLKRFVLKTQWIPGQISGLNVDSYYDFSIRYP